MLDLEKTTVEQKESSKAAVKDKVLLDGLLAGLLSKKSTVKYNSFKILYYISQENPEVLYGKWSFFESFLKSTDDSKKFYAIHLLVNLAKVDAEGKFEGLFDDFYGILNGKAFIPACHVAYVSYKIVNAKPELADKVTERLLNFDGSAYKHPELVKANAVTSFSEYFDKISDKNKVVSYVRELQRDKSSKVKKEANAFVKKWNIK
jgi:hypothetical protein